MRRQRTANNVLARRKRRNGGPDRQGSSIAHRFACANGDVSSLSPERRRNSKDGARKPGTTLTRRAAARSITSCFHRYRPVRFLSIAGDSFSPSEGRSRGERENISLRPVVVAPTLVPRSLSINNQSSRKKSQWDLHTHASPMQGPRHGQGARSSPSVPLGLRDPTKKNPDDR